MELLNNFNSALYLTLIFVVLTSHANRLELVKFSSKNFNAGESGELEVSYHYDTDEAVYPRWLTTGGRSGFGLLPVILEDRYSVSNKFSEPNTGVSTLTVKNIERHDLHKNLILSIHQGANSVWLTYYPSSGFYNFFTTPSTYTIADRVLDLTTIRMNDIVPQKVTFNPGDIVKLRCTAYVDRKTSVNWLRQSVRGKKFVTEFDISNITSINVTTNYEKATSGEGFNMESVLTLTGKGVEDAGLYFCNAGDYTDDINMGASRSAIVLYSDTPLLGGESIVAFFSVGYSSVAEIPSELSLNEGDPLLVLVNVLSRNDVTVRVYHNGLLLADGHGVKLSTFKDDSADYKFSQHEFNFKSLASTHAGHYKFYIEDELEGSVLTRSFNVTMSA